MTNENKKMKIGIIVNEKNEVTATTYNSTEEYSSPYLRIEVDNDVFGKMGLIPYKYVNNNLVVDTVKQEQMEEQQRLCEEKLKNALTREEEEKIQLITLKSCIARELDVEDVEFVVNVLDRLDEQKK